MRSQPSYIRTIKPNENKSPTEYDSKAILHQIKYLGLQENIRIRRAGFAYRNTFEKMVQRFYLLSPATSYAGEYIWEGDARSGCERILHDTGIAKEEWQMGVTKAFIKNPETVSRRNGRDCGFSFPMRVKTDIRLAGLSLARSISFSLSNTCEIGTGTTWPLESSVPGAPTCVTSTSAPVESNASG
jgi:hypothetical protein